MSKTRSYLAVAIAYLFALVQVVILTPEYFSAIVLALPVVVAALTLDPRGVMAVAAVTFILALYGAYVAPLITQVETVRILAFLAVAYVCVRTAQVRALTKLKAEEAEEARHQTSVILESIADAFYALDQGWRFTYLNAEAEQVLRRSREQLLGKSIWEELPQTVGGTFDQQFRKAVSERTPVVFAEYYPPLQTWFDVHAYPSETGLSVYLRDITVRKRDEAEREELLQQVQLLAQDAQRRAAEMQIMVASMVDGVFVWDVQGCLTFVNEAAKRMLGLSDWQESGCGLEDVARLVRLRHPDGEPVKPAEMTASRALQGEVVLQDDQILYNRSADRDLYIRSTAAPIRDAHGQTVGAVAVVRDVTELTELERQKDQFISVAAHELKTPVTIMKGAAQILLRSAQNLTPPQVKLLQSMNRGADRIDRIVRDLLDISRLHAESLQIERERVDLPALVEGVVDQQTLATGRNIKFTPLEPAPVLGDASRLEQVLTNLLDNALKYSPGGDVEVSVLKRDGEAVVSVRDWGVGIPVDKQQYIFQRFYRAHTGTQFDYGGIGVGLYISQQIVQRHGGRLWFDSEEGKGSTFSFSLPLA